MSVDARATLVTFYEEHDPAAVDRVDSLLASHSKSAIRTALLKKYDSAPEGWERLSDTRAQSYRKLLWPAAVAAAVVAALVVITPGLLSFRLPSDEPLQLKYYAPQLRPAVEDFDKVVAQRKLPLVDYGGTDRGHVDAPWCEGMQALGVLERRKPVTVSTLFAGDGASLTVVEADNAFVAYEGIVFNRTTMLSAPMYVLKDLQEIGLLEMGRSGCKDALQLECVDDFFSITANLSVFRFASVVEKAKVKQNWRKGLPRSLYDEVCFQSLLERVCSRTGLQVDFFKGAGEMPCRLGDSTIPVVTFGKLAVFHKHYMLVMLV